MGQSLVKVYVHIVFSTKYRKPLITEDIESDLFEFIKGWLLKHDCNPLAVGGYRNHVHILCSLPKEMSISRVVKGVKQYSSLWVKEYAKGYGNFYWQSGYAAFSVAYKGVSRVIRYIQNQKDHHQRAGFKEELLRTLKRQGMEYDERYLWD